MKLLHALALLFALTFASACAAEPPVILVLGDSLSAGYGVAAGSGWVDLLERRLSREGYPHRVVNASISGDTSRGALARLPAALERHHPALLIIELGGNDGLRGIPANEMEANLVAIIDRGREAGARILLVGIRLPPNYGPAFTEPFYAVYGRLAEKKGVPLVPFLLEGVALRPEWMQADGLHPTAEGQPTLLENVWRHLFPLLAEEDHGRDDRNTNTAPALAAERTPHGQE
ncbi:arylesterase [Endothiovibrio diazotrophicus]